MSSPNVKIRLDWNNSNFWPGVVRINELKRRNKWLIKDLKDQNTFLLPFPVPSQQVTSHKLPGIVFLCRHSFSHATRTWGKPGMFIQGLINNNSCLFLGIQKIICVWAHACNFLLLLGVFFSGWGGFSVFISSEKCHRSKKGDLKKGAKYRNSIILVEFHSSMTKKPTVVLWGSHLLLFCQKCTLQTLPCQYSK